MNAKRDSLVEGGTLLVGENHWMKTARSSLCSVPHGGTTDYEYTLHHLEYLWLDVFDWGDDVLSRGMVWFLLPQKPSRFLAKADDLDLLKWEEFKTDEEMIQHLRWIKTQLPKEEQVFNLSDVCETPEPAPITLIMDRVRAIMFKDAGGTGMTAAVDFKTMLSDAYVKSRRDAADGHHQSMIAVMLDAASDKDLASKPLSVQASSLIRFVANSQPPRALRRYIPYEMQEQEITRRSLSESGRFVPLLIAAWENGNTLSDYKELKAAVLHKCSGSVFVEHVKLLHVRAKLSEDITEISTAALCDMLRGEIINELDTAEMKKADNITRCAKLGELLYAHTSRSSGDTSASKLADKAAADKMRASDKFKSLAVALDALVSATPNYFSVITLLAPTAEGRIFLSGGTPASATMGKFKAARQATELDTALNKIVAVDEDGTPLRKSLVSPGLALKLIKGKFAAKDFDPWMDLCYAVIAARDGHETANAESKAKALFWADYSRLVVTKFIMLAAMKFIGHDGRTAGSYASFHDGMTQRARKIKGLPSSFLKKEGLTKMLARIGGMVMTEASERDATMLDEPLGIAHLRTPFFPTGSIACDELALLDKDLEEARSKARLHEDYGGDEDGNFRTKQRRTDYHSSTWSEADSWEQQHAAAPKPPGSKLERFSVYLTKHGLLYGCKFLVVINGDIAAIPHNTCLGCLSYLKAAERRSEWCNKRKCTHHNRPAGLDESKFYIINIRSANNSEQDATKAAEVISSESEWVLWGGANNKTIMGGDTVNDKPFNNAPRGGGGGRGGSSGGGAGSGGGGGGGGGNRGGGRANGRGNGRARGGRSKAKGTGGKGKGGNSQLFARQR